MSISTTIAAEMPSESPSALLPASASTPASPRARTRPTRGRPRTGPPARPACASVREPPCCCSAVSPGRTRRHIEAAARPRGPGAGLRSRDALTDRRSRTKSTVAKRLRCPISTERGKRCGGINRQFAPRSSLRSAPGPSAHPPGAGPRTPPRPNQRPGLQSNVGHLLGGAASPLVAAMASGL